MERSVSMDTLREVATCPARNAYAKPVQLEPNVRLDASAMAFQRDSACGQGEECSTWNTCTDPSVWPREGDVGSELADSDFEKAYC